MVSDALILGNCDDRSERYIIANDIPEESEFHAHETLRLNP
jgi:hypothetical protein